ncbi:MAG: hypothetical protein OXU22_09700 [Gammaproteobacteria bacterium]|nr:hypothetical protein [Gammaproteobacteria bacterium]
MAEEKRKLHLGAGKIYFDPFDADGDRTGETYLGDSPGFTVTMTSQRNDVFDSDAASESLIQTIERQVEGAATLTVVNVDDDTLRLFIAGEEADITQSATAVVDEAHNGVKRGRWYQLGMTDDNPHGVLKVSAVAVTDSTGGTTYSASTDYDLDADLARIYIKATGVIADDADILVDYTPEARTVERVRSRDKTYTEGLLRYIEDNAEGDDRIWVMPNVELSPSGEAALKSREAPTQLTFAVRAKATTTQRPVYLANQ